jgi:hypothetical protein
MILAAKSGVVFAIDSWDECFARLRTPNHKVQLEVPELFGVADDRVGGEGAPFAGREHEGELCRRKRWSRKGRTESLGWRWIRRAYVQ